MIEIVFLLLGIAIGLAFHRIRTREIRPAFKAACDRLGVADEKLGEATKTIEAQEWTIAELSRGKDQLETKIADLSIRNNQLEQTVAKIRGLATRMKGFNLSRERSLPAKHSRQRVTTQLVAKFQQGGIHA